MLQLKLDLNLISNLSSSTSATNQCESTQNMTYRMLRMTFQLANLIMLNHVVRNVLNLIILAVFNLYRRGKLKETAVVYETWEENRIRFK